MKAKVGDNVKVLAGKDKGKEGKVIKTLKKDNRVVVEGVNMVKRNTKPRTTEEKGGIISIEAPIHVSNVKVISKETKKETKVVKKEAPAKEVAKKAPAKKTTKKGSK